MSGKIEWKFVADPPDQTSGDDDWYSLNNGYISPDEILADQEQIQMVWDAQEVIEQFFKAIRDAGIRGEM